MLTKEDLLSIQVLIQQSLVANNKALIEDIDRRMDAKLDARFEDFEKRIDAKLDTRFQEFEHKIDSKFQDFEARMDAKMNARFEEFELRMDAKFQDFELKMDSKIDQKISDALQTFFRRDLMPFLNIMATKDDIDKIDRRLISVENKLDAFIAYQEKVNDRNEIDHQEFKLLFSKMDMSNYKSPRKRFSFPVDK